MKKYVMSLLISVLCANSAFAENLKFIGASNDKGEYILYVDADSISRDGEYVKAWEHDLYTKPQHGNVITNSRPFILTKVLFRYRCKTKEMNIAQVAYFNEHLDPVGTLYASETRDEFVDPIPGSLGETALLYVCRYSGKTH